MDKLKKFIYNFLKTLFCLYVTSDIFYTHYIYSGHPVTLQMKMYLFLLVILAITNWAVLFSKSNIEIKLAVIIITILCGHLVRFIPDVKYVFDYDTCLDMSYCAEGLKINTEHGSMTVNKENCLKYNYEWNEQKKYCYIENKPD